MLFNYSTYETNYHNRNEFEEEIVGDKHIIKVSLPGYKRDNIKVSYIDNEKFLITSTKDKNTYNTMYVEAINVDVDSIRATMKEGLLKIEYKKKETEKRQIEIEEE